MRNIITMQYYNDCLNIYLNLCMIYKIKYMFVTDFPNQSVPAKNILETSVKYIVFGWMWRCK